MSRSYHVEIARHAADADAKWVDNLLSHFAVHGVAGGKQGSARRITDSGVYHIALVRALTQVGLRTIDAVSIATQLLRADQSTVALGPHLELRLDRAAFQRLIDRSVDEAVEAVVPAARGRPPKRRAGR